MFAAPPHLALVASLRRDGARVWQTAGGVVVDPATGSVLLVKIRREVEKGRSGWTWPKGRLDPGEGPIAAALREIEEETGVVARPLAKLASLRTARALRHYYLCAVERACPVASREAVDVRWVPLRRAKALLDRKRDRAVLRAARQALEALTSVDAARAA